MNKQEFIQRMKEEISKDFSELEIAKYIYVQLGKEKSFDEKYYFGNSKVRNKIYKLAEKNRINSEEAGKSKKIICVSLSYLYRDILKEFGITTVIEQEMEHKFPVIFLKDGRSIRADLQLDLYNIQTKSKMQFFGTKENYGFDAVDTLTSKENIELDKKIGYIKDEQDYRNNAIDRLKEKTNGKNASELLKIVLTDDEVNNFDNKLEYVEIVKYYKAILNYLDRKLLNKKIFSMNCYKQNDDGEKEYSLCLYSVEKEGIDLYIFSKKENRFMQVEIPKIEELEKDGLVLGMNNNDRDVRRFKKFLERDRKAKEKCEKMFE